MQPIPDDQEIKFSLRFREGLLAFFAISAFVWIAPGYSRADEDCTNYRMDAPGESMEHVQTRDQEAMGICYAETGAQIADAIRFSRLHDTNYNVQTSAQGIALGISDVMGVNSLAAGGGACWALRHVNRYGICDKAKIEESADFKLSKHDGDVIPVNLEESKAEMRAASASDNQILNVGFQPFQAGLGRTEFKSQCLPPGTVTDADQVGDIGKALKLAPSLSNTAMTALSTCLPNNPFKNVHLTCEPPHSETASGKPNPEELRKNINQLLNRRADGKPNLPIEIHYCSVILDKGYGRSGGGDEAGCGAHASLIIGRRKVGKSCQFLVRNSWGTDCDVYSEELAKPANCEGNGNIWLDADRLTKNSLGIVAPPEL